MIQVNISRFIITVCFCLVFTQFVRSQSVYAPINSDYTHLIKRYEIKNGRFLNSLPTQLQPYARKSIAQLADSVSKNSSRLSPQDKFNLTYLRNDNWEWSQNADNDAKRPFLRYFLEKKSDFYHYRDDDFEVHVNPVIGVGGGLERGDVGQTQYFNSRGLELRGMISKKIGFYTFFTDNQALFPTYVANEITQLNAVPNEGFYKRTAGKNNVDFITARGYITFDVVKNVSLQFGHDKNFVGSGYRSLALSDYSNNYLFLKLNTNVWKINYQNIFGQLTAEVLNADGLRPKKYFAMHHLSVNVTKNFNIGLFETVMFARNDTVNTSGGSGNFDFNYLNPIIFYRSAEQQLGSPDNALLGMDFKWNFLKRFSLYGQLVIDEFVISQVRSGRGWWGNKQAGQIGMLYVDALGINNLDIRGEVNIVRPYTYRHNFKYRNFTHYNQALAHPIGANFYEFIGIARYQPIKRLNLTAKLFYTRFGADSTGTNWGKNIFTNQTFQQEFGNKIAQGIETNLIFADFNASYQIRHNMFIDLQATLRQETNSISTRRNLIGTLSFRWNIPRRLYEF